MLGLLLRGRLVMLHARLRLTAGDTSAPLAVAVVAAWRWGVRERGIPVLARVWWRAAPVFGPLPMVWNSPPRLPPHTALLLPILSWRGGALSGRWATTLPAVAITVAITQ